MPNNSMIEGYHFSSDLHTSSNYDEFLEAVRKYYHKVLQVFGRPVSLVDLGSGDCQKLSEYARDIDIVFPFEINPLNCEKAGPYLQKFIDNGQKIGLLSDDKKVINTDCREIVEKVEKNSVHLVTSRGGPQQGILNQIYAVLKNNGYYIKSGHIASLEAMQVMSELQLTGFETQISYAKSRLNGIDSYTNTISSTGFEIIETYVNQSPNKKYTHDLLIKMLRLPAFWGPKFDPEKHKSMFESLKSKLQVEQGEVLLYVPVAQDVLIVAKKVE